MTASKIPGKQYLQRIDEFDYDALTGNICRSVHDGDDWVKCGTIDYRGYIRIQVYNRYIKAHNIAWYKYYKEWPQLEVHHIDEDKTNNKIANLCLATPSQNSAARDQRRGNRFQGVRKRTRYSWGYDFRSNGKYYYKGGFVHELEAVIHREMHLDQLGDRFVKRNVLI